MFRCSHPTVWSLIRGIEKDIAIQRLLLNQANVNNNETQRKKYKKQADQLSEKVSEYPKGGSKREKLAYLRSVALITLAKWYANHALSTSHFHEKKINTIVKHNSPLKRKT